MDDALPSLGMPLSPPVSVRELNLGRVPPKQLYFKGRRPCMCKHLVVKRLYLAPRYPFLFHCLFISKAKGLSQGARVFFRELHYFIIADAKEVIVFVKMQKSFPFGDV